MNKNKKRDLIFECSEEMAVLLRKLESDIGEKISSCNLYWGDIIENGKETEGTKLLLSTSEDELMGDDEPYEYGMTAQEMVQAFHTTESSIKNLMGNCLGLDHITDKYLEILEFEKKEARKALGEGNKEYIKLL